MRRSYLHILHCFSSMVLIVSLGLMLPGCSSAPKFWSDARPNQKKILVTFPPLYAIADAVGGDDVYVLCMLTTTGPHGYQGAATDLLMTTEADLFVYNGLSLDDDFAKKMVKKQRNRTLPSVNVGTTLKEERPDLLLAGDDHWHVMPDGSKHKHEGGHDPHFWLGPPQAIEMTKIIRDKFIEIDPANKKGYEERAGKFIAKLADELAYGKEKLKNVKNKKIITMHEAFGYFAHAYGIKIEKSIQLQPGMDTDAVSLGKLIDLCKKEDGPRVIAVEPQYPRNQAEQIKASLKHHGITIDIITLDPLETADIDPARKVNPDPGYYLKKMRENINTLAGALK